MPTPYYLTPKKTKLPAGHDDTLDPSEEPTDSAVRVLAPSTWPVRDTSPGPNGPRDRPAGAHPTDPARRGLPAFAWPRFANLIGLPEPDLDPDIALWPQTILSRWPFTGPPAVGIWPTGWLGVDNTGTVWVCTRGGQPGTWGAIGGPGTSIAGVFNVRAYGATGNGTTDDTAAINATLAAVNTAGGGIVYYPPGTYLCTAQLNYYPNTEWAGAGMASVIKLGTDLYTSGVSPANFIVPATSAGWGIFSAFRMHDLTINGPGTYALGQATCRTIGFRSEQGNLLDHVHMSGFFSGFEEITDHTQYLHCSAQNCYYGLDFSDGYVSAGANSFYSCVFTGNNLASVHVGGLGVFSNGFMSKCHFGFAPVAILSTGQQTGWDGSSNPVYGAISQKGVVLGTKFEACAMEQCGNSGFLDISPAGSNIGSFINAAQFTSLGFTWGNPNNPPTIFPNLYSTTNAPLNFSDAQGAWVFALQSADLSSSIEFVFNIPVGSLGCVKVGLPGSSNAPNKGPSIIYNYSTPIVAGSANPLGSAGNWAQILGGVMKTQNNQGWGQQFAQASRGNIVYGAVGTINVGDCVELVAPQGSVQRCAGVKPFFGVAQTPSDGSAGALVLVQLDGVAMINTPGSGITYGNPIYLNTTTPYQVDQTSTAKPVVGQAMGGVTGGAQVQVMLMPKAA